MGNTERPLIINTAQRGVSAHLLVADDRQEDVVEDLFWVARKRSEVKKSEWLREGVVYTKGRGRLFSCVGVYVHVRSARDTSRDTSISSRDDDAKVLAAPRHRASAPERRWQLA